MWIPWDVPQDLSRGRVIVVTVTGKLLRLSGCVNVLGQIRNVIEFVFWQWNWASHVKVVSHREAVSCNFKDFATYCLLWDSEITLSTAGHTNRNLVLFHSPWSADCWYVGFGMFISLSSSCAVYGKAALSYTWERPGRRGWIQEETFQLHSQTMFLVLWHLMCGGRNFSSSEFAGSFCTSFLFYCEKLLPF